MRFIYVSLASVAAYALLHAFWQGSSNVWINPLGAFFGSAAAVLMVAFWCVGMATVGDK